MFVQNEDGSLSYTDPETGETIVIESDDDDFAEMMNVKKEIDSHVPKSEPKSNSLKEKIPAASKHAKLSLSQPSLHSKRLRVGDDVKVYIRSVSKQSSQYTVTTNPAVQGRKAKDLKQEAEAQKRLQRLEKKLGGSLERIYALEGQECDGTVRATSQTGDWIYVQPNLEGLPVGVAIMTDDAEELAPGDKVRVKLGGIDEQRGQLFMQVFGKQ
jgi:ribosomal protein S1